MTTVSRTFVVTPPPAVVLGYLQDFANAEEWDPGTQRCVRIDDGPIRVGSQWHNESRIAGRSTELTYELAELTEERLVFVGTNDTATSTDTITARMRGAGTEVTYEAVIEMRGAARLVSPLVKVIFEKVAGDTERRLVEVLDRLQQ